MTDKELIIILIDALKYYANYNGYSIYSDKTKAMEALKKSQSHETEGMMI